MSNGGIHPQLIRYEQKVCGCITINMGTFGLINAFLKVLHFVWFKKI